MDILAAFSPHGSIPMMVELDASDYETVLPLVKESQIPGYSSYAFSVLEGRQQGHVFVDNFSDPQSALIINRAAPSLACGAADMDGFDAFVQELLGRLPESQVLTFWTISMDWHRILSALPAVPRHRTVFSYHPSSASEVLEAEENQRLPGGFRLERIDAALAQKLQESLDPWGVGIWGGPEGFAQSSVGFCAVKGGRIGSACTAAFVGGQAAEMSIHTDEEFRRQGLGGATCRALIRHCLAHGLRPDWSCNRHNLASVALAERLGFVRRQEIKGYLLQADAWDEN